MTEQTIRNMLEKDRLAKYCGMVLKEVGLGYATVTLDLKEHHLNGADLVQGGVVYTLADFAFAAAANFSRRVTVTINVQANYIKPANGDYIVAKAKVIHETKSLSHVRTEVFNDKEELVATFVLTGFRTKQEIKDEL